MFKIYERTAATDKKFIKEFDTLKEAYDYVYELIDNLDKEVYYVRLICGEYDATFGYGPWTHFYGIESESKIDYSDIIK